AAAKVSTTFTAFFTYLMHGLFNDAGLLWIDAANPKLRKLESAYFIRLIESAPAIAKVVTMQEERLQQAGYGTPIFATTEAANLFYVKNGARHLLKQQDGV
ncbi:bacillithiol biosynthesis protein BshC, partial [Xanthomonas sacchari]|uniref:bacillithiol biosynthesis protein BshC n=1 Tax=Xanthomonas sacchari TaxID=56458 RepID=UPI00225E6DA2